MAARRGHAGTHLFNRYTGPLGRGFDRIKLDALAGVPDLLECIPPSLTDLTQRLLDLIGAFERNALCDGRASHVNLLSGAFRTSDGNCAAAFCAAPLMLKRFAIATLDRPT